MVWEVTYGHVACWHAEGKTYFCMGVFSHVVQKFFTALVDFSFFYLEYLFSVLYRKLLWGL